MSDISSAEIRIQLADLMVEAILEFIKNDSLSVAELNESRRNVEDMVDALMSSMSLKILDETNASGARMATMRLADVREFLLEQEI